MLTEKALVLSATMAVLAAPVAHPDSALAMSWQERLAEMQQRKEQVLSEARGALSGGDSESKPDSAGDSYMDKISGQLSLKIQDSPGGGSSAPAPEQEAPKAKKEESRSRFSFQQYGDKDESKSAPEATSKPPGDALPAPAAEPKEEKASKGLPFSFSFGKKDDAASPAPAANNAPAPLGGPQKANPAPAEPSVSSPAPLSFKAPEQAKPAPKADPAPAPAQGDSKPWWEKAEEVVKPDAAKPAEPLAAKKEEAKKPEAPKPELPKPAPMQKVEAKKDEVKQDAKKAVSNPKGAEKGRQKKTNGFALFASQMLMLGAFVGGTYALLFKSDALEGLMQKADDAILSATEKK